MEGITIKSYEFSMESILELRETEEQNTMEEFAIVQNQLIQEKAVLSNLHRQLEKVKENILNTKCINELKQLQLYRQSIEDKIEKQIKLIQKKTQELDIARLELIDAQKNRKIMENLKEIDYENYLKEMKLKEQIELDELAILKFNKSSRLNI